MSYPNETYVWFMRHGKPVFDYVNCTHDELMEMLSNGHYTPLDKSHGIDFTSLPQKVELICHSPARRATETAQVLQRHLNVRSVHQMDALREVKFDRDIIRRHEYQSLEISRSIILTRWFENKNKSESFKDSMERAQEIEVFLQNRQEEGVILVTHGLFLRLLEIHFVQGKRSDINLSDLLAISPLGLGRFIKVMLNSGNSTE